MNPRLNLIQIIAHSFIHYLQNCLYSTSAPTFCSYSRYPEFYMTYFHFTDHGNPELEITLLSSMTKFRDERTTYLFLRSFLFLFGGRFSFSVVDKVIRDLQSENQMLC